MRRFDKGPCYMEENDDGRYVLHSDHAAELARVEKENTLLRAECEAARVLVIPKWQPQQRVTAERLRAVELAYATARAATDAAGILKGAE